ncbi:zinc ion binding protein [Aureococcus anophagefferens]|nr:zinc ion binding protein [Aureococcus anophagefferens]
MAMRCHYDVLGVPRTADDATIRKAYKKLAVALHPDKAQQRGEAADAYVEQFREVQGAYECLSDADERAHYDAHRDEILRGDDDGARGDDAPRRAAGASAYRDDYAANLWPYFSRRAYANFDDDAGGYDDDARAREAAAALTVDASFALARFCLALLRGVAARVPPRVPRRAGPAVDVRAQAEPPHLRDLAATLANKKERREAEKQRARSEARRAYDDSVSRLADYCKRRDPRVAARRRAEAAREAREAAQKQRAAEAARDDFARKRAAWLERRREADAAAADDDDDDDDEAFAFRCRDFGSAAALEKHEDSRAHRAALKAAKKKPRR